MSLFQCEECGCCENTALTSTSTKYMGDWFDWTGIEDRKGKMLCSVCAPTKYSKGGPTGFGQWHGEFRRVFLPKGMFKTNQRGNLEHIETGSEDFRQYEIEATELSGELKAIEEYEIRRERSEQNDRTE